MNADAEFNIGQPQENLGRKAGWRNQSRRRGKRPRGGDEESVHEAEPGKGILQPEASSAEMILKVHVVLQTTARMAGLPMAAANNTLLELTGALRGINHPPKHIIMWAFLFRDGRIRQAAPRLPLTHFRPEAASPGGSNDFPLDRIMDNIIRRAPKTGGALKNHLFLITDGRVHNRRAAARTIEKIKKRGDFKLVALCVTRDTNEKFLVMNFDEFHHTDTLCVQDYQRMIDWTGNHSP